MATGARSVVREDPDVLLLGELRDALSSPVPPCDLDGVRRSDFDSSTTSVAQSRSVNSLEDLTTRTSNGPVKLVAEAGTITIEGGADTAGVSANGTGGTGDVLLEARGTTSDVIVNASVYDGTGLGFNVPTALTSAGAV